MIPLKRHSGFTLVEVLVAITLFAIVVSTLFGSFKMVISTINPLHQGLDDYEMARNAMDRIILDLKSLCLTHDPLYSPTDMEGAEHPDPFQFFSEKVSVGETSFSLLRFASFEHLGMKGDPNTRIGILHYYVEMAENSTMVLKRADTAAVLFKGAEEMALRDNPVLCERVRSFELSFVDQEGKQVETWDSDASEFEFATPYSIKIKLEIGEGETFHLFSTTLVLPTRREKHES